MIDPICTGDLDEDRDLDICTDLCCFENFPEDEDWTFYRLFSKRLSRNRISVMYTYSQECNSQMEKLLPVHRE